MRNEQLKFHLLTIGLAILSMLSTSGCSVVGAAATGVSLGAKAASTTVGAAGTAVHATGAAADTIVGGDDEKGEASDER